MNAAAEAVLTRLEGLGFEISKEPIGPFGSDLPFVVAVAWDRLSAQIALVAESDSCEGGREEVKDGWRQLLFALSGLRHHLTGGKPAGFGVPVLLAVVDEATEELLREMAEEILKDYAMFQRADLNLVSASEVDDEERLDIALAPLLPRCREALAATRRGETIERDELRMYWASLREKVLEVAREKLDDALSAYGEEEAVTIADELAAGYEESKELPTPWPVDRIELKDFRSFSEEPISLDQVTVLSGGNGAGKTSVLEGLEILWSSSTQRRPAGVKGKEYGQHVVRGGEGAFEVRGPGREEPVRKIEDVPDGELARAALTQEAVTQLVGSAPKARLEALAAITGLEVPELDPRTKEMADAAKRRLDAALAETGMKALPGARGQALPHLEGQLDANFAAEAPQWRELAAAESVVAQLAAGCYRPTEWSSLQSVVEELSQVDAALKAATAKLESPRKPSNMTEEVTQRLREQAKKLFSSAAPRQELAALLASEAEESPPSTSSSSTPLAPPLAARWIAQAEGVESSAHSLDAAADEISDERWKSRLRAYVNGLLAVVDEVPRKELRQMVEALPPELPSGRQPLPKKLLETAGFTGLPPRLQALAEPLAELESAMRRHAGILEELAGRIEQHPAFRYAARFERVLAAVSRYEIARRLRLRGSPTEKASEELLRSLLEGRLAPVLRELIAALVRFEWYFEPAILTIKSGKVLIGGLATPRPDRDARLVLNTAERGVVGLSWFLALHLLQTEQRRQVLVLDDPAGNFDLSNRSAFVSTLRAFVRLLRPRQLIVATHDEGLAVLLEEELGPVDGWPEGLRHLRAYRDLHDCSRLSDETLHGADRSLDRELAVLGLAEPKSVSS